MTFFVDIIAFMISAPLLLLIILFVILKSYLKSTKQAMHWTVDITTLFFILAVDSVMYAIWQHHFFGVILTCILIIGLIFTVLHWLTRKEIHPSKLFKGIWRLNFLFFISTYIILFVFGLVHGVLNYT